MFKDHYLKALLQIEEMVGNSGILEIDRVLDGYYGYNMSEVAAFFELLNIVDVIAANNGSKLNTFQFNNNIYKIDRIAGEHESITISLSNNSDVSLCVSEPEMMECIDEKCKAKEKLYASCFSRLSEAEVGK